MHHEPLTGMGHQTVGQLDQRLLTAGAVGHLCREVGGGGRIELSLQVFEQPVPTHGCSLPCRAPAALRSIRSPLTAANKRDMMTT